MGDGYRWNRHGREKERDENRHLKQFRCFQIVKGQYLALFKHWRTRTASHILWEHELRAYNATKDRTKILTTARLLELSNHIHLVAFSLH